MYGGQGCSFIDIPESRVRPAVPAVTGSGPFPCPGIVGLISFTLCVNDAHLTN